MTRLLFVVVIALGVLCADAEKCECCHNGAVAAKCDTNSKCTTGNPAFGPSTASSVDICKANLLVTQYKPTANKFCKTGNDEIKTTVCLPMGGMTQGDVDKYYGKGFVLYPAAKCDSGFTCVKTQYVIFADAGSGGTRYKVYENGVFVKGAEVEIEKPTFAGAYDPPTAMATYVQDVYQNLTTIVPSAVQNKELFLSCVPLGVYATAGARVAQARGTFPKRKAYDAFRDEWAKITQGTGASLRMEGVTITGRLEALFGMMGGTAVAKGILNTDFAPNHFLYWEIGGASMQWAEFTKGKVDPPPDNQQQQQQQQQQEKKKKKGGTKGGTGTLLQLRDAILGPAQLREANKFLMQSDPGTTKVVTEDSFEYLQSMVGNAGNSMVNHVAALCVKGHQATGAKADACPCLNEAVEIMRKREGDPNTGKLLDDGAGWKKLQEKDTKGIFAGAPNTVLSVKGSPKSDKDKVFKCMKLIEEVYKGADDAGKGRLYKPQFKLLNNALTKSETEVGLVVLSSGALAAGNPFCTKEPSTKPWTANCEGNANKALDGPTFYGYLLKIAETEGNTPYDYSQIVVPALVMETARQMTVKTAKGPAVPLLAAATSGPKFAFADGVKLMVVSVQWDKFAMKFFNEPALENPQVKAIYSTNEAWQQTVHAKEDKFWKEG